MMADESHLEFLFPFNQLDDSSFNLALYEISHGPLNFSSNRLETLLFNPIEQPELSNSLSSCLNPDSNFIAGLPSSSYLAEDDINSRVAPLSNKINFSVMHLNARSLVKNLDKLNLMLGSLKKSFSVIGISETWLTDYTAELVNITGYSFISNHRKSKTGGGVGIYLHNDLQYKLRNECKLSDPDIIESLFVEITVPHGKNIIVGCVYRPPNQNTALFLDKLNDILSHISKDNKQCYVMGDFNLDLLQYNHHTPTQEFIDTLFSFAFIPLISNPTRLTFYSATLIDNIFTNNLSQNVLNGVVLNDLSDHLPVFAYFSGQTLTRDRDNKAFTRRFTDENLRNFNENVSNTNWSSLLDEDPNMAYNNFIDEYSRIYNACFPLKAIKGKLPNNRSSPWSSPGLLKSINKKNRLYKKFIKSPSFSDERIYKTYKNKLNHLIRLAKRKYYDTKFESAKHDLRTTWKLLNEVINKRKSRSPFPSSFKSEGKTITDPEEIADKFCKYFTNIGPNLAGEIREVNSSASSFIGDVNLPPITLKPTNPCELESICSMFASGKAPGYDNISMRVIKHSIHLISAPLSNIINLSLQKGIFPDKLKLTKVIPIYKANDPSLFTNYRPISLLSNFSKFFEKVMHNRITEFAEQYNILYRCQFGFRKNYSTSHALIHLINRISTAIDQRETTVGVFLDLSKAFDTLDHEILFAKLEHYGIRNVALQWIKSYFSNRRQFVQINQTCSSTQTIKCGVPQGSILGPLFFILYINDLPRASKLTEPLLFAADTSIFFSNSNPSYLENVLNNELLNIDIWLKCNKLSINVQKTSYVIFRPSQRKVNHNFSLSFGGQPLTQSNVIKFLGVYFDEHLTWKYHINFVCKQIAKSVGILSWTRFYLSCKTKLMLYYTLIYPYITYCNSTWSSTYVSNLNRIYYLQKRAVRAVTNSDYRAHTAPLFSKLKILDIFQINTLDIAKFMFRYHNNLLPPLYLNLFMTNSQVHTYDTRTAGNYRMHSCRTNIKKFTILYQGPRVWNCLPASITNLPSFSTFKNKVLEFLLK